MISHEHHCILLHVPKTAGVSMETAFQAETRDHRRPQEYIDQYGLEVWSSYFKFAFVRNPWERAVSCYFYQLAIGDTQQPNFENWLKYDQHALTQQIVMLKIPGEDLICVDFLGRYETLVEDWVEICRRIGSDLKLPHLNKSRHTYYKNYYTPELIKLAASHYKDDIEEFKYQY